MNGQRSNSPQQPEPDTAGAPLPLLLQFRLKTLLMAVALCSVAFAVMTWIGAVWSMVVFFFVLLIVGHVAGNAIGTKLRDGQRKRPRPRPPRPRPPTTVAPVGPSAKDETPHLGGSASLNRVASVLTLAGAAAGVLAGRLLFLQIDRGQFRSADWALALVSFAVMGGFLAFLASSFFQVGLWPAAVCFFSRKSHETKLAPGLGDSQE